MIAASRFAAVLGFVGVHFAGTAALGQQDYPTRPVHLMVGFPAGSGADIGVRFVADRLHEVSKQRFIVENKPGAGSNIAVGLTAKARPDGYTVLMAASSAMAGSRYIYKDFTIDTEKEFEPVAIIWRASFLLAVSPTSPLQSVAELTRLIRSKDRSLYAYSNQTGQLAGAYYLSLVEAKSNGVSYRGAAEAVADMASGTIDFMMLDGAFASGQVRAGRIKPLAVTTAQRTSALPETPTLQEAGLTGFEFAPFWAAYLPKGTPQPIVDRLSGWLIEVARLEATHKQYTTTGSIAVGGGPAAVRAALRSEIEKWAAAVKAAGVEPQ
jgi:tripartite-type tricarboxylate transporter receptor subunit TctC